MTWYRSLLLSCSIILVIFCIFIQTHENWSLWNLLVQNVQTCAQNRNLMFCYVYSCVKVKISTKSVNRGLKSTSPFYCACQQKPPELFTLYPDAYLSSPTVQSPASYLVLLFRYDEISTGFETVLLITSDCFLIVILKSRSLRQPMRTGLRFQSRFRLSLITFVICSDRWPTQQLKTQGRTERRSTLNFIRCLVA